ncbi:MAG: Bax inhibitor-1/YccA family protein [Desulfovibrionaceae bacterium]|nr:Bax inhibitor-1/YccA family protein [Desulfovibrionaceae bacterium]
MRGVYGWMSAGLALTAAVAMFAAASPTVLGALFSFDPAGRVVGLSGLTWFLLIAELGLVFFLSARIRSLSGTTATSLFLAYSALNGVTLSMIFLAYTSASIFQTFIVCAGMFGAMSLYGMVTKRDLTGLGSLLFMGLIGLLIAMVVNIFLKSAAMEFVISGIGVLIFTGLTAYDTQKLKTMGEMVPADDSTAVRRGTILGALTLYLDFINLFLMLLRFMGQGRE